MGGKPSRGTRADMRLAVNKRVADRAAAPNPRPSVSPQNVAKRLKPKVN